MEVVIPNDTVSDGTIINRTRRGSLRIRTGVGIDYETDIDTAEEPAISAMESVKRVAPAPKPQAIPKSLDDSAITLELRYWIKDPNVHKKWQAKRAVIRRVKDTYDENGIWLPYHSGRSAAAREANVSMLSRQPGTETSIRKRRGDIHLRSRTVYCSL